jgi:diacylglycerol kinase family enzyme
MAGMPNRASTCPTHRAPAPGHRPADEPDFDPASPLQFIINARAGSSQEAGTRALIEAALQGAQRQGQFHACRPGQLPGMALRLAQQAAAAHSAVVAVGGDGTANAVAQAACTAGCAMGVVPLGTFNYFARTQGIPTDPGEALRLLLSARPVPVRVGGVNERLFLVNASLGLYPDLLEDREAFKARFGRSRWVALWAAAVTLLRAQRPWRLRIEQAGTVRHVRTLTLFVGNNRLQLEQFGVKPAPAPGSDAQAPRITAVMLKPVGTWAMIGLMLRGALGTLGDAPSVEHFDFDRLVVEPALPWGRRAVKVAFDGEVGWMRAPLDFRRLARPIYLLAAPALTAGQAPPAGP